MRGRRVGNICANHVWELTCGVYLTGFVISYVLVAATLHKTTLINRDAIYKSLLIDIYEHADVDERRRR